MPEVAIGFFPDVGAGVFYNKFDDSSVGMYLALTGQKFNRNFAIHKGLGIYAVDVADWDSLLRQLIDGAAFNDCKFEKRTLHKNQSNEYLPTHFNQNSLSDIFKSIPINVVDQMRSASPLSINVSYEYIKRMCDLSLMDVLNQDYSLAMNFVKIGEFQEGIRALLIDKDKTPKWKYSWDDLIKNDFNFENVIPYDVIKNMFEIKSSDLFL